MNILEFPYQEDIDHKPADKTTPIIRSEDKCIKCSDACRFANRYNPSACGIFPAPEAEPRSACPQTHACKIELRILRTMRDPLPHRGAFRARRYGARSEGDGGSGQNHHCTGAPAVRSAWAESFGLTREFASPKRMAAALRRLGFDYVFRYELCRRPYDNGGRQRIFGAFYA
jgi:NADH-quinone oxidoreductase subunit G